MSIVAGLLLVFLLSRQAHAQGELCALSDCNFNSIIDSQEIEEGQVTDFNRNLIPDLCEVDCNANQVPDDFDTISWQEFERLGNQGSFQLLFGGQWYPSTDYNRNRIPDLCEADCNKNRVPDDFDTITWQEYDQLRSQPDFQTPLGGRWYPSTDYNKNRVPDLCEADCNKNQVPDDIDTLTWQELEALRSQANFFPIMTPGWTLSSDINKNKVPDQCETDCNFNQVPDDFDTLTWQELQVLKSQPNFYTPVNWQPSPDINGNRIPDRCEQAPQSDDCNRNGIADAQDVQQNPWLDRVTIERHIDANGAETRVVTACGFSSNGTALPCLGVIDACEISDCNKNGEDDQLEVMRNPWLDRMTVENFTMPDGSNLRMVSECGTFLPCKGKLDACEIVDCNANGLDDQLEIRHDPGLDRFNVENFVMSDGRNIRMVSKCGLSNSGGFLPCKGQLDACEMVDCNKNGEDDQLEIMNNPWLDRLNVEIFAMPGGGNIRMVSPCGTSGTGGFLPCKGKLDACELVDCNNNGQDDSLEILDGRALDVDRDGVIDACKNPVCLNEVTVNYQFSAGLRLMGLSVDTEGRDLNQLFKLEEGFDGTTIYRYQTGMGYYEINYLAATGWFSTNKDPNALVLRPGEGFFVEVPDDTMQAQRGKEIRVTGKPLRFNFTRPPAGEYALLASQSAYPLALGFTGLYLSQGFPAQSNDKIFIFNSESLTYESYYFDAMLSAWKSLVQFGHTSNGPILSPGDGFVFRASDNSIPSGSLSVPPSLVGPFSVNAIAYETLTLKLKALDPDSANVTFVNETTAMPSGASFDEATGTLKWRPTASQLGVHVFKFSARDESGNIEAAKPYSVTIVPDTIQPTIPSGLSGQALSATQIKLTWQPSTDNSGEVSYRVYRNGVLISSTLGTKILGSTALTYTDSSALPGSANNYYLVAYDRSRNVSAASNQVSILAPSAPIAPKPSPTPKQVPDSF